MSCRRFCERSRAFWLVVFWISYVAVGAVWLVVCVFGGLVVEAEICGPWWLVMLFVMLVMVILLDLEIARAKGVDSKELYSRGLKVSWCACRDKEKR